MMARDIPNDKIQHRCFEQELTLKRYAKQTLKNKIKEYECILRYYKLALKKVKLWESQGKGSAGYCVESYQEMMFYVRHRLQDAKCQARGVVRR